MWSFKPDMDRWNPTQ